MGLKPKLAQIPFPGGSSLTPTGAMQFRDDWPGLFIRGDNAAQIACAIRRLQQHCSDNERLEIHSSLFVLVEIAEIIENDVIVRTDEPKAP